jgi:hypothetical protein
MKQNHSGVLLCLLSFFNLTNQHQCHVIILTRELVSINKLAVICSQSFQLERRTAHHNEYLQSHSEIYSSDFAGVMFLQRMTQPSEGIHNHLQSEVLYNILFLCYWILCCSVCAQEHSGYSQKRGE